MSQPSLLPTSHPIPSPLLHTALTDLLSGKHIGSLEANRMKSSYTPDRIWGDGRIEKGGPDDNVTECAAFLMSLDLAYRHAVVIGIIMG